MKKLVSSLFSMRKDKSPSPLTTFHQGSLSILINFASSLSVSVNERNSWRFWRSKHLAAKVTPIMFNSLRTNKSVHGT